MYSVTKKIMGLICFSIISLSAASVMAAETEEIIGHLNFVDQDNGRINVNVETMGLTGPAKRDMDLDLAQDVRWVICLGTGCGEYTGMDGAADLNFYSQFEPYGINVQGSDVTMIKSGDVVTEVWVSLR